jgi:Tfp pilus assembly protein PilE
VISGVKDFLNSFGNYVNTRKAVVDGEVMVKKMEEAQARMLKEKEAMEKKMVEQNNLILQSQTELNTQKMKIEEMKKSLN